MSEKQPIKMPSLSDTMETGHLVQWLKKPGDKISKGDILAEIESDKSVIDMEAFEDGYLAGPLADEDSDIPVGEVIAYLSKTPLTDNVGEAGGASETGAKSDAPEEKEVGVTKPVITPASEAQSTTKTETTPVASLAATMPAKKTQHSPYKMSPYARGLARELGVDPALLTPGPGGVIKSPQVIAAAMQGPMPNLDAGPPWRYRLFTPMHRAIASNMMATVSTPVFHISTKIETSTLTHIARSKKQSLSLMLARALALSVKEHPDLNAAYTPVGLAVRKQVDVGMAVDVAGGLITPVLRDMTGRSLEELSEEWQQLKQRARDSVLKPKEYQGATIYLSNLGMFDGVSRFDAIVPAGACAILAVAASEVGMTEMTLSVDHRVVYGAEAARFLQTLKAKLQSPEAL